MMTWFSRISRPGSIVSGVQTSPPVSTASAAGAMPTTVWPTPFSVMRTADDGGIAAEAALPQRLR